MNRDSLKTLLKIIGVVFALYMFLVGINGLSSGIKHFHLTLGTTKWARGGLFWFFSMVGDSYLMPSPISNFENLLLLMDKFEKMFASGGLF